MAWQISFERAAEKDLDRLDPTVARRILAFLNEGLALSDNPRRLGEALKGSRYGELWKYRVGDYRIIASIRDAELTILIVGVGNRRGIYRR